MATSTSSSSPVGQQPYSLAAGVNGLEQDQNTTPQVVVVQLGSEVHDSSFFNAQNGGQPTSTAKSACCVSRCWEGAKACLSRPCCKKSSSGKTSNSYSPLSDSDNEKSVESEPVRLRRRGLCSQAKQTAKAVFNLFAKPVEESFGQYFEGLGLKQQSKARKCLEVVAHAPTPDSAKTVTYGRNGKILIADFVGAAKACKAQVSDDFAALMAVEVESKPLKYTIVAVGTLLSIAYHLVAATLESTLALTMYTLAAVWEFRTVLLLLATLSIGVAAMVPGAFAVGGSSTGSVFLHTMHQIFVHYIGKGVVSVATAFGNGVASFAATTYGMMFVNDIALILGGIAICKFIQRRNARAEAERLEGADLDSDNESDNGERGSSSIAQSVASTTTPLLP